jgi:hypothetical protein
MCFRQDRPKVQKIVTTAALQRAFVNLSNSIRLLNLRRFPMAKAIPLDENEGDVHLNRHKVTADLMECYCHLEASHHLNHQLPMVSHNLPNCRVCNVVISDHRSP